MTVSRENRDLEPEYSDDVYALAASLKDLTERVGHTIAKLKAAEYEVHRAREEAAQWRGAFRNLKIERDRIASRLASYEPEDTDL